MSLWLDEMYLKQIGYRLEGFKPLNTHQWNCRCPICGDSEKKKSKRRGYFYERDDGLNYQCFNCQASMTFGSFLKDFDLNLYKQYALEKFKDKFGRSEEKQDNEERIENFIEKQEAKVLEAKYKSFYDGLPSISELDSDHPAAVLLAKRKIPRKFWDDLFYCEKFVEWTEGFSDKYSTLTEHPRIIIPFWDHLGRSPYFQGRSFGKVEPRYFTYKILEDSDYKAYGLDKVDRMSIINVVEGPFDSMFLDNAVAVASSALHKFHVPGCKHRYIFDNEPRNKDIVKLLRETIKDGKTVVIWPDEVKGLGKDINELVLAGVDVKSVIEKNSFSGLQAQVKFNQWVR